MAGLYLAAFAPACFAADIRIHDIQGRGHESPLAGQQVTDVPGIVTALRPQGFYLQDPLPDEDAATSEGIFVFAPEGAIVAVGDAVAVSGSVVEFRPGEAAGENNLSATNIRLDQFKLLARGQALPAAVELGAAPLVIKAGAGFDPKTDALDFYESFEGMRVRIAEAKVVGPPGAFGELAIVPLPARPGTRLSARGALVIAPQDFNAQRVFLTRVLMPLPPARTGDRLTEVVGVFDYAYGHYRLQATAAPLWHEVRLEPEFARSAADEELSIASLNVENLSARNPAYRFDRIAAQIVSNLRSPDIVGLLEVQDNNGVVDDGTVAAGRTLAQLSEAIRRLGGPAYSWAAVDPEDKEDGGAPGANIRQVLLFNPARVNLIGSPTRIAPSNPAFLSSRKPLAAIFSFRGRALHVLLNHFVSKRADDALFGARQPPQLRSEAQRLRQAQVIADHVRELLARDAAARVVVMGDLNDFEFSPVLQRLQAAGLSNPVFGLPEAERYSYIHEGNAQMLDHILLGPGLSAADYDIVHVNAEFPLSQRASDHDPVLLRVQIP